MEKWPFLDQYDGITSLEKRQFLDFLNFFFYSLERRFFVLEYGKRHFTGLYCRRRKVWKMAVFGPIPWVNPFGIKWIFELLVFSSLERRFFVLEYSKRDFPGLYCLRKKVGKISVFRAIPWVNPFGKTSIFWLLELLVFIA